MNLMPRWILARGNAHPRGRADGRSNIELLESDALRGQAIDVGGGDVGIAVATQVTVPHVVNEDEDKIRPVGGESDEPSTEQGEQNPINHGSRVGRSSGRPAGLCMIPRPKPPGTWLGTRLLTHGA